MGNRALSFISIGTNDFIENYMVQTNRQSEYNVTQFQDFLVKIYSNYIEDLYKIDLRKIAIINVPPLGSIPLERTLSSLINGDSAKIKNDASDYVFFDSIHLTQKAYSIISQHFLSHGIKDL